MDKLTRSCKLIRESWEVLRGTPQLALFPVISGIASLIVAASFFIPVILIIAANPHHDLPAKLNYPLMFGFYAVSYFVVIFFNAALVTCAHESLSGRPTTFAAGIQNATKHLAPILGWTLIAATVGMLLRMVSERSGIIGRIVIALLGFAWTMLTYFVVPVLVVDNKGPVTALKESGALLRRTWGEQLIGGYSMNLVFILMMLLGFIPVIIGIVLAVNGFVIGLVVAGLIAMVYWLVMATISSSLTGIYNTALYMYATSGTVPKAFTPEFVQGAFRQSEKKNIWGS